MCCSTALLYSIRAFHDNQLGSTPWISPGAYNHHTPSAHRGTVEPHPPVARTLQCNIMGPLGAMKRQSVVYFKAFYSSSCSPLPHWLCGKCRFSPFKFCSSASFVCLLGVYQEGFTACFFLLLR